MRSLQPFYYLCIVEQQLIKTDMKHSVKQEIREFALSQLVDFQLDENQLEDIHEVHNQIFNMDYYIIGYYECDEWLKFHHINVFEGLEYIKENEEMHFGESLNDCHNSERLVNLIVYFVGMDIIDEVVQDYKQNFLNK